ncbi:MAG: protein kinase, partial [Myxococcales bacterium]|nr:protein kinase [Myxococcales bacterium]
MARLSGWAPPDAFDDFQLVRQLGAGGMGAVYLAHDRALDRLVAVKFIVGDFVDRVARERFAIEARAIARLHHPNVVAVYRIGQVDGHPYLAYEFISGQRLDALRLPLPWPEVLRIAVGLARGLAAVHARGVLHRDVKPANVMLDEQGRVKLLDFGLARMMADGTPAPNDVTELLATPHDSGRITAVTGEIGPRVDDLVLTPANSLVGTPMFIAPELWAGMPATPRSDLYSMGLILYAMLAGALPHVELRGIELAHARRNTDLPSLVELVPAAPRPLTELVDRMVRRHPEDRPVGLDDIRDKLEDLAALYRPAFADHEERDAQRVRASRERVAEVNGRLAARFFELWLAGDPQVAELLPADPGIQRHIVEMSLRLAVEHLGHADQVVPVLEDLGRRHLGRGLDARHLGTMGRALLAALGELDPHWEPETARAWSVAFGRMAMVVQRGLDDAAAGMKGRPAPRGRWEVPLAPPRTRWATHDGADLGYQVVGSGVIDIVVFGDWVTHVERMWQHPAPASFFRHLASLGRVVLFDRRGIGMSDRGRLPTLEQQVDDAVAVLDAVRSDRAVLLALGDGLAAAATLAATRPGRVRAL